MNPIVKVIAHTKFLGVPAELLPADGYGKVVEKAQDQGSDMARLIECAGRTCYDSMGQGRSSAEYHQHIREVGHGSVTEHASISFYLDNISRGLSHELVRHRAGCAISQRSTRYVDEDGSPWILHPLLTKFFATGDTVHRAPNGEATELSLKQRTDHAVGAAQQAYRAIVLALQAQLIAAGADKQTARKQARGAARGLLGNALCTSMVWTANIRALRNVIEQRANPGADAEIRVLANRLYEEASLVCPEWFNDYEKTTCPDGIGYGLTTKYRKV